MSTVCSSSVVTLNMVDSLYCILRQVFSLKLVLYDSKKAPFVLEYNETVA